MPEFRFIQTLFPKNTQPPARRDSGNSLIRNIKSNETTQSN
jgi:hypothetical protein